VYGVVCGKRVDGRLDRGAEVGVRMGDVMSMRAVYCGDGMRTVRCAVWVGAVWGMAGVVVSVIPRRGDVELCWDGDIVLIMLASAIVNVVDMVAMRRTICTSTVAWMLVLMMSALRTLAARRMVSMHCAVVLASIMRTSQYNR
jgi:hypothetical protein